MARISRQQMFMGMARMAALRSTCFRLNVGCVLVREKNVVAIGYNGAPSGVEHCTGNGCQHMTPNGCGVVHAEKNAFSRLPFGMKSVDEVYVTHSPCQRCATLIYTFEGCPPVVYYEVEYRDRSPVDWLLDRGVRVYRLAPSGCIVDPRSNVIVEP